MASLAWYNLGLVALARDDRQAAYRWFRRSADGAREPALLALATRQLEAIRATMGSDRWSVFARIGGGHDDNVALRADELSFAPTGEEGEFAEAQFALSGPVGSAWRVDAGAFMVDYFDLDGFDQAAASIGARRSWPTANRSVDAGVEAAYLTLDGRSFERSAAVAVGAVVATGGEWILRSRYRATAVRGLGAHEGLTGPRHELQLRFDRRAGRLVPGIEYRFEDSDCDDPRFASRWQQVGFTLRRSGRGERVLASIEAHQRITRYDERADPAADRRENRTLLVAAIGMRIGTRLSLAARAEHTRNRSGGSAFDYDRNRFALELEFVR